MTRPARLVAAVAASLTLVPAAAPHADARPAPARSPDRRVVARLSVTSQPFVVHRGEQLTFGLHLTGTARAPRVRVDVQAVSPASDLAALFDGLDAATDHVTVTAARDTSGDQDDQTGWQATAPTTGDASAPDTLTLDRDGVWAVRLSVLADDSAATPGTAAGSAATPGTSPTGAAPLAAVTTFVDLAGGTQAAPSASAATVLRVATIVGTSAEVTAVDPSETNDDRSHLALGPGAADAVDRLLSAAARAGSALTVHLPAGVAGALRDTGGVLAARARTVLAGDVVLSEAVLPLDPGAAALAGERALYVNWLREGEDTVRALLGQPPSREAMVAELASSETIELRRDLGTRLVVLAQRAFDELDGSPRQLVDSTRAVDIALTDGTMAATTPDRIVADQLRSGLDPAVVAARVGARLLLLRQRLLDRGESLDTAGVVVATADLGTPDPDVLAAVTATVATTPGLHAVTADGLAGRLDTMRAAGTPVVVHLPSASTTDADKIRLRVALATNARGAGQAVGSMLPSDDPRPARWTSWLDALASPALTDAEVRARLDRAATERNAILGTVGPPAQGSFTLSNSTATIHLRLTNSSDVPLRVRIHLAAGASKVTFSDNDRIVTLAPDAPTDVPVEIHARSNGRIPAEVTLSTPSGNVAVGALVPLVFTVNGWSGLANLVTGAALILLATWWVRHVRRTRRDRAHARHPVRRLP